ncbi:hypothetical protein F5Y17DRAFT_184880 [Xylariaceae sp. FL0594]|nr:hypothetical protein F5Y17DRAFT_184880 [Xylariaceae sp. FL0594]
MSSGVHKKSDKGCWTCKNRKVRCDGGQPTCANCARLRKACQGYGVRLSWPRDGDTKRSIVGKPPVSLAQPLKSSDIRLVHTSFFDIHMYSYLAGLRSSRDYGDIGTYPLQLILPAPETRKSLGDLNAEDLGLLQNFETDAYTTFATATPDTSRLRDILLRMALMDDSITSRAVLHAILALSSLQRDGLHLQAAQHKTAAVGALAASAKKGIQDVTEAARHVAANMLLCSYEIYVGTDSYGHWPWYLTGAREILEAANLQNMIAREDIKHLVEWVFFHDVHARLSLFHWKRGDAQKVLAGQIDAGSWHRDLCAIAMKLDLNFDHLPRMLRYLADAVNAVCLWSRTSSIPIRQLQEEVNACEEKILEVPELDIATLPELDIAEDKSNSMLSEAGQQTPSSLTAAMAARPSLELLTELFRIAILVYISRICEAQFGETDRSQSTLAPLLERAFSLLPRVPTCERLLPVFVIGCEARTDERRMAVLDLVRRTEQHTRVRKLTCLRRALDSVWIQDDLHADQDVTLHYLNKVNVVISSSPALPTFV